MNIRWLKFWIWLGVVATLITVILPPLMIYSASADVNRYRECLEGKRFDCDRTMVWNLVDAAVLLEQQGGSQVGTALGLDLFGARGGGALRTSETSPFIEKVEPVGMSNANGVYTAKAGDNFTMKVTVSGVVTSVELFQIEGLEGAPVKVTNLTKGSDGIWTASHKLPPGLSGALEIRAYGDDPKDLAVLELPVAAN